MNNISWFLYAVDVVGSLGGVLMVSAFLSTVATVVSCGFYMGSRSDIKSKQDTNIRWQKENNRDLYNTQEMDSSKYWVTLWQKSFKIALAVALITSLVSIFIPSTKTMYLIMGSEVGESVVMSETGQRVQDAINKKLDEYLGER